MLKPLFIVVFTAQIFLTESSPESSGKPHHKCRADEIFVQCPDTVCVPKTCTEVGYPVPCVDLGPDGKCPSEPACICKEGYVRNNQSICIPMKKCPSCGGDKNAKSGCGVNCGKRCSDYFGETRPCPKICDANGCDCKKGYYYDEKAKKCVSPAKCTKICRDNEVLSECVNGGCDRRNCSQLDQPKICIHPHTCKKGCVCRDGYLRHLNGTCVPKEKCPLPKCCENEVVSYCVNGGCEKKNCSQLGQPDICIDPIDCIRGCICKHGYLRNDNGICVPIKKCPCRKNEVMSDCIQGGCQAKTCSDLNRDIPCIKIDPKYCTKGCLCKDGYLRADNGTCVPISSCTFKCTRNNEVFVRCPPICPPQTCESINQRYNCPRIPIPTNTTNCRPACRCKTGYYRNKINECISKDDCLKCTGPNEYFSCGVACDNVCSTLSERNQTNCPIKNIVCNKMCYCEEGYARAKNKTCIPINKCTEPQCPVNEKYEQFPSSSCKPQKCSQLGFPLNCTALTDDTKCSEKPGCVCIDGYVRNNKGVCIPQNECPSCGGDTNAKSGCGINCNRHCSNIGKESQFCIALCKDNSCDCKEGYYLDDNTGKCVLPKDCTPVCEKDEVYNDCIQGQCQPKNCSDLGKSIACPRIDPRFCIKGCICKDEHVRAENGTCIPKKCCPTCGGDPNAEPGCGLNCNKQCSSIGVKGICPRIACPPNGCECKAGFYFDKNRKKCVLPKDCGQQHHEETTYKEH